MSYVKFSNIDPLTTFTYNAILFLVTLSFFEIRQLSYVTIYLSNLPNFIESRYTYIFSTFSDVITNEWISICLSY